MSSDTLPKLHNASWPGVVGKGPDSEPPIDLDTMLDLTAAAEVDGVKFDGTDLFLFDPHVSIDSTDDDLKQLAEKVQSRNLVIGSVVAPVWPPTGGGSAMGSDEERGQFLEQVRKGCGIAKKLRELGVRPYGVVRIDSAAGPGDWVADPDGNQAKIAATFKQAADIAADHVLRMVETQALTSVNGARIAVKPDTICVHGDNPAAVKLAERVRNRLEQNGVTLKAF